MNRLYRCCGKRMFDLAVALPAALALLPIIGVVSLVIRQKLGSPVIFRQCRGGRNGKPMVVYKFRTMTDARDASGELLPDDQRLTRLGAFLRRFSLDELPQLWNVINGTMSIVGPRPLLVEYLDRYTARQARRHEVAPGITGWAQVNGRNALTWEERFEFDVWYVDHVSIGTDMKIIWLTLQKVFKRSGVSAAGHATMPKFMGTKSPSE